MTGAGALTTTGGQGCPVCGVVASKRVDLGDYALWSCSGCGCWSSDALWRGAQTSFEAASYFDNADADRSKWTELVHRLAAPPAAVGSVLDAGCGNGAFLAFAREQYPHAQLVGVELDAARAAQARERNPQATIHTGDALEAVEKLDGTYDLITLWDVFEHLTAPARMLQALERVLSPTGVVYIQTIHEDSVLPRLGRLSYSLSGRRMTYPARRTHEAHHLVFFSKNGLRSAADGAGLRIDQMWFDRLARERMDGGAALTLLTSTLLSVENALGNGLFVNLMLKR